MTTAGRALASAIIAAGGRGVRLGADQPKQFLDIGGRTILERSMASVLTASRDGEVVVAVAARPHRGRAGRPDARDWTGRTRPWSRAGRDGRTRWPTRSRVSPADAVVVIHDAARPFVTAALIERATMPRPAHGAAIAALPCATR
jgi:2-C-methyl-D-erythritol 4-phosphate cytidylyltransferase / 2-C-methyl-D-erythritol 2,4-cyclodiphosphate synthase